MPNASKLLWSCSPDIVIEKLLNSGNLGLKLLLVFLFLGIVKADTSEMSFLRWVALVSLRDVLMSSVIQESRVRVELLYSSTM